MGYFGKIIKNALIFGAVGACLALAAPYIAGWLGFSTAELGLTTAPLIGEAVVKAHATPLWLGAYFGAFGAIHAAIEPIISGIFGGGRSHGGHTVTRTVNYSQAPELSVAPELPSHQPELVVNNSRKFTDMLSANKAPVNFQDKLNAEPAGTPDRTV